MKRYMKPKVVGSEKAINNKFVLDNLYRFGYTKDYNVIKCQHMRNKELLDLGF